MIGSGRTAAAASIDDAMFTYVLYLAALSGWIRVESPSVTRKLPVAGCTGITSGALLAYPALERRLCIELMQPVADAVSLFRGNLGAGSDPRLEIKVGDGRHELMRSEERFDLVTLEPPPPAAAAPRPPVPTPW